MTTIPYLLYTLQTIEIAVDKARKRIQEIETALENDENVVLARQRVQQSETELHDIRAQHKDSELEQSSLTQKIHEVDELLYSGRLTNPKELKERQDELASLHKRQEVLQSHLAELHDGVTQKQHEYTESEASLTQTQVELGQAREALAQERDTLNNKVKKKLRERKTLLTQIPEEIYEQYKALRKQKHGIAVALLKESTCTACHIEQNLMVNKAVEKSADLVYCRNCGRILAIEN